MPIVCAGLIKYVRRACSLSVCGREPGAASRHAAAVRFGGRAACNSKASHLSLKLMRLCIRYVLNKYTNAVQVHTIMKSTHKEVLNFHFILTDEP
eukprot:713904-Pleurochrysis_carterae.AAC.1